MIKVLYLGWIGFHNFGDELMWQMFKEMSDRYLPADRYTIIPSLPGVEMKDISGYDAVVLGGGSLLIPGYVDILCQAAQAGKRVIIWGSGYDCINRLKSSDGAIETPQLRLEDDSYRDKLTFAIEKASYCGVRGPWTFDYLLHQGIPQGQMIESGDSGLLISSSKQASMKRGDPRDRWIGINWGTAYNRIYGADEGRVEDQLVEVSKRLLTEGYKLYYYSVWGADNPAIKRLYERVGNPEGTFLDTTVYTGSEYLDLVRGFEATLNFKLHANVVSAAAGIPFVCLGYRFKSFDFMHAIGMPEYLLPTNDEQLGSHLLQAVSLAIRNREQIAADLDLRRQQTRERLTVPFAQRLF